MRLLLVSLFLCSFSILNAQDEILLMNGKKFTGSSIDTTGLKVLFEINKSEKKQKMKAFYKDEVFSIDLNGTEKIFYEPSIYFEDSYSVQSMHSLVNGTSDARYHYKTKWVIPTGLVVGAGSALLMKGSIFILLVPIVYTGIVQIPIVKVQPQSISSKEFIGDEFYKEGYNHMARTKRTKHALLSSIGGVVAGILVYELTK
jgi:hypothetical protein